VIIIIIIIIIITGVNTYTIAGVYVFFKYTWYYISKW